MATDEENKADRDDEARDDDQDDADSESSSAEAEAKPEAKPAAKVATKPETKSAAKGEPKPIKPDADDDDDAADAATSSAEDDEVPERMRRARPRRARPAPTTPAPAAAVGKSIFIFVGVVGVLFLGLLFLSNTEMLGGGGAPKWKVGQTPTLEITLDPRDDLKLSCASKTEVKGKRCEWDTKTEKAAGPLEDKTMLRPYTTVDGIQFLAAGLWSQPDLEKAKRPAERFTVKCRFSVDGMVKSPAVRWDPGAGWNEKNQDWFAGEVSACSIVK